MTLTQNRSNFKPNVKAGERSYPFFSAEVVTLQSSLKKVDDYLKGLTDFPKFTKGKGTYLASRVILENMHTDVRDCFEIYKKLHPATAKLSQGKPNPQDRFLRMLSVWTEAGAISIKNYKIQFEPILLARHKK